MVVTGADLKMPDNSILKTREGVIACEEAIIFLRGKSPMYDLKLSYGTSAHLTLVLR